MTKEQSQVQDFMLKAEQPCPRKPTIPDLKTRKLRARLMMEEVLETINDGLGLKVWLPMKNTYGISGDTSLTLEDIEFVEEKEPNLVELADGLADLVYVSYYGTANAFGLDMEPVFQAVQDSNMSKFIDGHRREDGKWVKGPSYRPVDLNPIIEAQINKKEV
jgi:predicted HAD superfamily Cof-like phosphohydrolase